MEDLGAGARGSSRRDGQSSSPNDIHMQEKLNVDIQNMLDDKNSKIEYRFTNSKIYSKIVEVMDGGKGLINSFKQSDPKVQQIIIK